MMLLVYNYYFCLINHVINVEPIEPQSVVSKSISFILYPLSFSGE